MCKTITLGCKLWPWKLGLKKSFKSFYLKIVRLFHKPYSARDFVPIKCIFFRFSVRKVSFQLPQNVTWTNGITHGITIRHKWGKIGPSYLFCKHVNLSFFYSYFFETVLGLLGREYSGKSFKKSINNFNLFSDNLQMSPNNCNWSRNHVFMWAFPVLTMIVTINCYHAMSASCLHLRTNLKILNEK